MTSASGLEHISAKLHDYIMTPRNVKRQASIDDTTDREEMEIYSSAEEEAAGSLSLKRAHAASGQNELKGTSHKEKFQLMLEKLTLYKEEHGNCLVPYGGQDAYLARWVGRMRLLKEKEKLPQDRIDKLNAIGFVWQVKHKTTWDEMYERLCEFKKKNGHVMVPQKYKDDPSLGRWVDTQREGKARRITPEQKQKLDDIGFVWSALNQSWDAMFDELCAYKEEFGDCNVTQRYTQNPKLGRWVKNQRLRKDCLSDDRIARLNSIGFKWRRAHKSFDDEELELWESMCDKLTAYFEKHGNCNVGKRSELGMWSRNQRLKKHTLTNEQIERLDEMGFVWDIDAKDAQGGKQKHRTRRKPEVRNEAWDRVFTRLCEYKLEHGNCLVPVGWPGDPELAAWVRFQQANKAKLTDTQIERLDSIGFVWDFNESNMPNAMAGNRLGQLFQAQQAAQLLGAMSRQRPLPPPPPQMSSAFAGLSWQNSMLNQQRQQQEERHPWDHPSSSSMPVQQLVTTRQLRAITGQNPDDESSNWTSGWE